MDNNCKMIKQGILEYKNRIYVHPSLYFVCEMNARGFLCLNDIIKEFPFFKKETLTMFLESQLGVSKDFAKKLERTTGISYQTWLNLQEKYEEPFLI